ncbi:MAG: hypothetical protein AB7K36_12140 [Chloroflexota bacterium]
MQPPGTTPSPTRLSRAPDHLSTLRHTRTGLGPAGPQIKLGSSRRTTSDVLSTVAVILMLFGITGYVNTTPIAYGEDNLDELFAEVWDDRNETVAPGSPGSLLDLVRSAQEDARTSAAPPAQVSAAATTPPSAENQPPAPTAAGRSMLPGGTQPPINTPPPFSTPQPFGVAPAPASSPAARSRQTATPDSAPSQVAPASSVASSADAPPPPLPPSPNFVRPIRPAGTSGESAPPPSSAEDPASAGRTAPAVPGPTQAAPEVGPPTGVPTLGALPVALPTDTLPTLEPVTEPTAIPDPTERPRATPTQTRAATATAAPPAAATAVTTPVATVTAVPSPTASPVTTETPVPTSTSAPTLTPIPPQTPTSTPTPQPGYVVIQTDAPASGAMSLANMRPGACATRQIIVSNVGSLPFTTYSLSTSASGTATVLWTDPLNGLQLRVQRNATVLYDGAIAVTGLDLGAALQPGESDTITLDICLPPQAGNAAQGQSQTITLTWTAIGN